MRLTLKGNILDTTKEEVEKRLSKIKPEMMARNKYYVKIGEKDFPVKQAVSMAFGIARIDIQTQDAYRILRSLGFKITER
ncbi:MAG: hypothetical protein U9O41_08365 [Candidatus Aerophobetes bacterium]|nr:hypothetical protein [Candidatus Aerophobetes bacterium]